MALDKSIRESKAQVIWEEHGSGHRRKTTEQTSLTERGMARQTRLDKEENENDDE